MVDLLLGLARADAGRMADAPTGGTPALAVKLRTGVASRDPKAVRLTSSHVIRLVQRRESAMKIEVKRIGNSTGLILPKDLLGRLKLNQGD
jgi:hypothetical protein